MSRLVRRPPSYRLHKASGQAVVTLDGRDLYLGPHGTDVSKAEYDRVVGVWLTNGRRLAPAGGFPELSINELMVKYLEFAGRHYRHDGLPTYEVEKIRLALRPLRRLYGTTPAGDFGPLCLKTVRSAMVADGLARSTINYHIGKIKRMFRWATENELIAPSVHQGLAAVSGLRAGREGVRETEPVRPVSPEHVAAVLPFLAPTIRAMVELQAVTGMRPGEVTIMRGADLDMTGEVWCYRPRRHKTQGSGHVRMIFIGPKGQEVLRPWLKTDPVDYLFSPAASVAARNTKRRADRRTPMTPSQARRKPKRQPKRPPRDHYGKDTYRRAISRACDKAGIPPWRPNQLRHTLATTIRRQFDLESAAAVLGHSELRTTQVYAEANLLKAREVMKQVG